MVLKHLGNSKEFVAESKTVHIIYIWSQKDEVLLK